MENIEKGKVILLLGSVLVVVALIYFLANYTTSPADRLKNEISSRFTCTCCEGSIIETSDSCFMAGGMREYIGKLAKVSNNKEEIMLKAVKKFGITSLINEDLRKEYWVKLIEDAPEDVANISIAPTEVDLGIVSNSKGIIIQNFKVKNEGKADLIITDLKTSCACLTASFIKDDKETVRVGRFSHSEGWTFVLKPGEDSWLRAYYDPRVTNWQTGHVERIITITSNDPLYFEKTVKITAELVP